MKLLYGIDILKHPKIKTEDDVKRIISHLNNGPNWIVNSSDSYIVRKTLSDSWVWDKGNRDITEVVGRLYGNNIVENLNNLKYNNIHFEVGRNPNKGFLFNGDELWGLVKVDNSVKARNIKRLEIPHEKLEDIAKDLNVNSKKIYNNMFYYVDSFSISENIHSLIDKCEQTIINFNEDIPFIIFKSQKLENEIKLKEPLGIFNF